MKKWLIAIGIICCCWKSQAHQPDLSTTMLIEQENGSWIFQVRAALTAFEYEVNTHYGKDSYPTPEKFKELVISHLEKNISIRFNKQDAPATLRNPYVKLGHETNVLFQVSDVPKIWKSVSVKNSSFKDISRNQSALIVLKKGFSKQQFTLNQENSHKAKLIINDTKFILHPHDNNQIISNNSSQEVSDFPYWIIAGAGIGLLLFLIAKMILRNKKTT